MIFAVAMTAVLLTMALALVRANRGPTLFDRILAVNMIGTKTVLLIAVIGFLTGRPHFRQRSLPDPGRRQSPRCSAVPI